MNIPDVAAAASSTLGETHPTYESSPYHTLRPTAKVLPEHARSHNRSLVLQTLYRTQQLSRADIARETGLTRVSVSALVAELLDENLVVERGIREVARPGKPAMMLELNTTAYHIIALDLSEPDHFAGSLTDLKGDPGVREQIPLEGAVGEDAMAKVLELVTRLQNAATAPILGVGVGSPGVVNTTGQVLTAPNLGWNDLDLQDRIAEHSGCPTIVANDANAAVLAEYAFSSTSADTMLIKVGLGIGAGMIVGGALIYGGAYAAGEIGQVMVGTDTSFSAGYDPTQCLEAWVSVPELRRRVSETDSAEARQAVLHEAGARLGVALAPVVGALNLSEIVLSGPSELLDGTFSASVYETVQHRTMSDSHGSLTVRMTSHGEDIGLLGSAVLVLSGQLGVS